MSFFASRLSSTSKESFFFFTTRTTSRDSDTVNYQSNLEVWDRYGPWKSTPGGSFFFLETNTGRALFLRLEDGAQYRNFFQNHSLLKFNGEIQSVY